MKTILSIVVSMIVLAGCAGAQTRTVWYTEDGRNDTQAAADWKACKKASRTLPLARQEVYQYQCMTDEGYKLGEQEIPASK